MDIDQKLIEEIIGRILAVTQPERIILFGSAAKGEMGRDSDLPPVVVPSFKLGWGSSQARDPGGPPPDTPP